MKQTKITMQCSYAENGKTFSQLLEEFFKLYLIQNFEFPNHSTQQYDK